MARSQSLGRTSQHCARWLLCAVDLPQPPARAPAFLTAIGTPSSKRSSLAHKRTDVQCRESHDGICKTNSAPAHVQTFWSAAHFTMPLSSILGFPFAPLSLRLKYRLSPLPSCTQKWRHNRCILTGRGFRARCASSAMGLFNSLTVFCGPLELTLGGTVSAPSRPSMMSLDQPGRGNAFEVNCFGHAAGAHVASQIGHTPAKLFGNHTEKGMQHVHWGPL